MPGPVFLAGERVSLRPIEEEDLRFLRRNVNDPDVWYSLAAHTPKNMAQEREWFEESSGDDDSFVFLICVDDEPVGSIGLGDIDRTWGRAEVGFWVTPDEQGQGYGTEAADLLAGYAFDHLRLHKLVAQALAFNEASRRLLERVGFAREGVLREEAFVDGEYHDLHRYGLLAREWRDR